MTCIGEAWDMDGNYPSFTPAQQEAYRRSKRVRAMIAAGRVLHDPRTSKASKAAAAASLRAPKGDSPT